MRAAGLRIDRDPARQRHVQAYVGRQHLAACAGLQTSNTRHSSPKSTPLPRSCRRVVHVQHAETIAPDRGVEVGRGLLKVLSLVTV